MEDAGARSTVARSDTATPFEADTMPQAADGGLSGEDPDISVIAETLSHMRAEKGDLPAERVLAAELGVKRYRVRQALALLRERGELGPAKIGRPNGEFARTAEDMVAYSNPIEVVELRMLLEPGFARQAAFRASPREIATILSWAKTATPADAASTDVAFHRAIAAASRNRLGAELYGLLRQVSCDGRIAPGNNAPKCPNRLRARDAEHREIAEAIADRNPEAAEAAMRRHLASVHEKIMARMSPR
ncbi:FadR/GntR family transcriptional regulator [Acuticoccus mangrovi]|uniref:FadR family transcriptional regulator n=1 Tax=Acuticoccus mangrovi TaxID=2796142 RepID=A0A934ILM3_9HYPH|nr:FCD domain-containing protein [Acuticoccus mangrovi]MBJ3774905.1 FadR family transcriptional regulator [Acuticoccus mangrovi]